MSEPYIPNAWPRLGRTYHVAQRHPAASDANSGTPKLPFKTISAAAAMAGEYDTVVIDEGVYREQVPIARAGNRNIPDSWIAFQAAPGKEVYLKGSDEFHADWRPVGPGVYEADLPNSLFEDGAYNPYEWPCEPVSCPANYEFDRGGYDPRTPTERTAKREKVRPAAGEILPETLGQIYVDGQPLEQLDCLEAVGKTPGSFIVSADGRKIICHFADAQAPHGKLVELTVRERCFKPQFPLHWSGLMIQTLGIVAEHAADPGAFSRCRPLTIRRSRRTGVTVRKTFHAHCSVGGCFVLRSNLSYLGKDRPTIISSILDGTKPGRPGLMPTITVVSDDGARTWRRLADGPLTDPVANYFLDEDTGLLLRHYRRQAGGKVYSDKAEANPAAPQLILQVSPDGGRTWGPAEELGFGKDIVCFTLMKLQNGQFFWFIEENRPQLSPLAGIKPDPLFFVCRAWLGDWRADRSGIDWRPGGLAEVPPEMGTQGVGEPQACQFPDGRIFAVFRQAVVLPGQDRSGYPSVKLWSVSRDNGQSWSRPQPLTFDDGRYVYSPTSFATAFVSRKNNRVYVILNILNRPNEGCLPRNVLHIAEVDQETLCVKRDTVAVIDEVHAEHTHLLGYSNFGMIEDRRTKNMLLFMKLESGPVYSGYDWNSYRYEIELPE